LTISLREVNQSDGHRGRVPRCAKGMPFYPNGPEGNIFAVPKPRIRITLLEAMKIELEQGEEVE